MADLRIRRAEQGIDQIIETIETLVSDQPLTNPRALEKMVHDLHDIRLSMKKLDKARTSSRKCFWRLSRRAVRVSVKIINLFSKA
jgi:uncharacterized membrane protein